MTTSPISWGNDLRIVFDDERVVTIPRATTRFDAIASCMIDLLAPMGLPPSRVERGVTPSGERAVRVTLSTLPVGKPLPRSAGGRAVIYNAPGLV